MEKDITVIGAAIIDILTGSVSPEVFKTGSMPVKETRFSFGGDALNEAVVLSRFGKKVELISKVGKDSAGDQVRAYIEKEGMDTVSIIREEGLETSANIVLVDEKGERYFLTNPQGSLRKLALSDIEKHIGDAADIVSFASVFVSPLLGIPELEKVFQAVKSKKGRTLIADMTKAKKGEKLEDLKSLLPYIDYILPNESEIELLTGEKDPEKNAELLIQGGVGCAVIKCGAEGCLIRTKDERYKIPAYPVTKVVDSTGAGDCFAAGFLWALSEGMPLKACGEFACGAASCAVEVMGAAEGIVSIDEPMRRFQKIQKESKR